MVAQVVEPQTVFKTETNKALVQFCINFQINYEVC